MSSNKLKLLLVAPSLRILGGQAVQADRLFRRLSEDSSFRVGLLPINPRLPRLLRWCEQIRYLRTVLITLLYVPSLFRHVPKYDCIHIFAASYWSFLLSPTPAILVSWLFRKKIVLNYRSGEADDHLTRWRRSVFPVLRLVDKIVVPSGYLVEVFGRHGFAATAIFNFVDDQRFTFRSRLPLRPVFMSNRNLEPLYDVACTLRAFAVVQGRIPEASLTIAGDGSQRSILENLTRELGLQNVHFVGQIRPECMYNLYDKADVYLNSPILDNMPGSIIEAFACGIPVVSTAAGGIPYIIRDEWNGLLVNCGDHGMMASKILRLLETPPLAEHIVQNARLESAKYTWKAVRYEWKKFYSVLCINHIRSLG
jgi:glycosyltransferase involved in cell wall biosynthesis